MWGWIQLGIWAGLYVANYLLRPKEQKPKPLTRDNLTLPRTEEGAAIPLVFGRCRVDSPVLVWNSDLHSQQNTIANGVYAFHYAVDMLFVVGIPMGDTENDITHYFVNNNRNPKLHTVWCGDKKLFQRGPLPYKGQSPTPLVRQSVVRPTWYGGLGAGGGLYGTFQWFWGAPDQDLFDPASPIGDAIEEDKIAHGQDATYVPGYQNQMLVSFTKVSAYNESSPYRNSTMVPDQADNPGLHPNHWTIGENASVDGFAFEVATYGVFPSTITARVTTGLYSYEFQGDADPVGVIYDVLTNSWGRIGLDDSKIDHPSFLAASTTLKAEGHGYSRVHYDVEDGVSIISQVLAQIDAALYEEPTTGKLVLKLIRADYDPVTLPHFTEANIVEIDDYGLGGWKDTVNEVRVTYTSRASEFKSTVAVAQSIANAATNNNRRRSRTIEYPGISNAATAAQVAAREMNVLSRPLKKISMSVNRDGYELRPGSCFRVTWPEYNLNGTVFRCQRVDVGQLFDNKVTFEAVEDAFASTYGLGMPMEWSIIPFPQPYPLVDEFAIEVPRWLARRAKQSGIIGDEVVPRFMPFASPTTDSLRLGMTSRAQPKATGSSGIGRRVDAGTDPVYGEYTVDTPATDFPITFTLADTYDRISEPYDTTIGLIIENVECPTKTENEIEDILTLASVGDSHIREDGANLIMLVDGDGNTEIMAFESAFKSGSQYTLENVWRGLLDTPARQWEPDNCRGYFLTLNLIGRRGYDVNQTVNYQVVPHGTLLTGSGGDDYATTQVRGRAVLPYPVQDMRVSGERVTGFTGQPAVAEQYKQITYAEEGLDVYGRIRERYKAQISRGDDADETLQDVVSPVTVRPYVRLSTDYLVSEVPIDHQGYGVGLTDGAVLTHKAGALAGCIHVDGHGTCEVQTISKRTLQNGDPLIGLMGLVEGQVLECWDPPSVTVNLPAHRNLAQNVRFGYAGGFSPWWTATGATIQTGSTNSVTRKTTDKWGQGSAAAMSLVQTLEIGNYLPRGMSVIAYGYFRQFSADANDTRQLTVAAVSSAGAVLASTASASASPPTTAWEYVEAAVAAPANTTRARLTATGTEVAAGGTANADIGFSEAGICVGQIYNASLNLLTNPSFVTLASWTVTTGGFVADTVNASPSVGYARGGAFATSTMYQEFALPAGYECGATAVVRCWRMQTIAGDTGTVTLEVMNAASVALATFTTGAENFATLNEWQMRVLRCGIPDGATKVRVSFTAVRTGGAGNSGACWDDVRLSLHKNLEATTDYFIDFTEPSVQYIPQSWTDYLRTYDAHPRPSYVFSAMSVESQPSTSRGVDKNIEWSDDLAHDNGVLPGLWASGDWIYALKTTRQSGGAAPCIEARDGSIDTLAAFTEANSFTVLCYFRVDETPWSGVECGLVGRKNLTRGWSLAIDATGVLKAEIEGPLGTATLTGSVSVVDGAIHMAALTYEPGAGGTMTLYLDGGVEDASSAMSVGEFGATVDSCRLRIMRSTSSNDTLPGMIGAVYIWDELLTEDQVLAHWNYARLPSAPSGSLVQSRSQLVWSDIGRVASSNVPTGFTGSDRLLCAFSTNQVAFANTPPINNGIAMIKANTNRIPSWDFAGASWVTDFFAAKTLLGRLDCTGRNAGLLASVTNTDGIKVIGLTFGATTTATLVFYARIANATPSFTMAVDLMNASDVVKDTKTVVLTAQWQRFVVSFTGWDASTATARIRFRSNTVGFFDFDLASVVWCDQGTEVPMAYQGPTLAIADTTMTWSTAFPRQFNSEGEMMIVGVGMSTTPKTTCSLMTFRQTTNNQNRREITAATSGQATFQHYDGAAAATPSTVASFDWSSQFTLRARWNRAMLLDNAVTPYAGLISHSDGLNDTTHDPAGLTLATTYGRTATFSESSLTATRVEINAGASAGTNMMVQKLVLRTREHKMS